MPFTERLGGSEAMSGVEVATYPYLLKCPKPGCGYMVVCKSVDEAAREEITHICPRYQVLQGKESRAKMIKIIQDIWTTLDNKMDQYAVTTVLEEKNRLGSEMRGISLVLAPLMNPYFITADEIVRETLRRRAAREAGEEAVTPGIGYISIYPLEGGTPYGQAYGDGGGYTGEPAMMVTPPPGYPQHLVDAARAQIDSRRPVKPAATTTKPAPGKPAWPARITDAELATIRETLSNGFPAEMVMAAYSVTQAEIDAIVAAV